MDARNQAQTIACMYIPNCDTGSQLRKAISHIFGRNKMCTRLIPQHIWVHYCRKHYQRSRYRNPKEYAKLQCDLVQKQIRAIREWSNANVQNGAAGTVKDWGLAVRKREQKRLDDITASGRKRTASAAFEQDSGDEDGGHGLSAVPATAVPSWLLGLCGKGYSTDAILDIFSRLHTEILNDEMPCFPDIEILPNIVVDQDEAKSPKGYAKRGSGGGGGGGGHKRSQSLGVGNMKSNYYAGDRRMSQPGPSGQDGFQYGGPSQKRQRGYEMGTMDSQDRLLPPFQRSRLSERAIETGRRTQPLAHRPVYPSINEHDDSYGSPHVYQHHLPAPTPQRLPGHSMAAHLETNNEYYSARRPIHQRSQSDMSFARPSSYSPSPSMQSGLQENPGHIGRTYAAATYQHQQPEPSMHYADSRLNHAARHSRHQSTPIAQPYRAQSMRDPQPSSSGYGYAQDGNTLPALSSRISESPQVQALYSARR